MKQHGPSSAPCLYLSVCVLSMETEMLGNAISHIPFIWCAASVSDVRKTAWLSKLFLHQCKSSKLKRHLFNKTNLGRESRFQGCPDWMCFLSLNSLLEGSESTQDIVILQRVFIYVDVEQKQAQSKYFHRLFVINFVYFLSFYIMLLIIFNIHLCY